MGDEEGVWWYALRAWVAFEMELMVWEGKSYILSSGDYKPFRSDTG